MRWYRRNALLFFEHPGPFKGGDAFTVKAKTKQLFRGRSKLGIADTAGLWVVGVDVNGKRQLPAECEPFKAERWVNSMTADNYKFDAAEPDVFLSLVFRTDRDLERFECCMHGDTFDAEPFGSKAVDVTDYTNAAAVTYVKAGDVS